MTVRPVLPWPHPLLRPPVAPARGGPARAAAMQDPNELGQNGDRGFTPVRGAGLRDGIAAPRQGRMPFDRLSPLQRRMRPDRAARRPRRG